MSVVTETDKTESSLSFSQNLKAFLVVGGFGDTGTLNNVGGFATKNIEGFVSTFVSFSDKEIEEKRKEGLLSIIGLILSYNARAKAILNSLGLTDGNAPIRRIAQTIEKNGFERILGHSFGGAAALQTSGFLAQMNCPLSIVIIESSFYSTHSIIKIKSSCAERLLITKKVIKKANLAWDLEDAAKISLQKGTKVIVVRRVGDVTVREEEQLYTNLKKSQKIFSEVSPELHGNLTLISIKLDSKKEEHYSKEMIKTLISNKILDMFDFGVKTSRSTKITKFNRSFSDAFTQLPSKYINNSHHWPLEDFVIEEEYVGSQYTFNRVLNTKGCNFKERALAEFKDVSPNQQCQRKQNAGTGTGTGDKAGAATLTDITYPPARAEDEDKFECSKGAINGYYIEKVVMKITKKLKQDGFKLKDGVKIMSGAEWGIEWERAVGVGS